MFSQVGGNHWNVVSGKVENEILVVNVSDSLFKDVDQANISIVSSLNRKLTDILKIKVRFHDVVKQKNGSDCSLNAIAFAKLICSNRNTSFMIIFIFLLAFSTTVEHQFYKLTKGREKVYKSGKFTKMGNS